jgi:RimJ/RimL family protein N-acetyltransferase
VLTRPISTERLLLRAYGSSDLDALIPIRSHPEVARFTYWEPQTPEQVRRTLELRTTLTALRAPGDALALAVVHRDTGELVGDVSLTWPDDEHAQAELGYLVDPRHQGRGYATEACRPMLEIAFDHVGFHRVFGRLEARNVASARVLEKLGMRREALLIENEWVKGEWQSELVYALLDHEWRGARAR